MLYIRQIIDFLKFRHTIGFGKNIRIAEGGKYGYVSGVYRPQKIEGGRESIERRSATSRWRQLRLLSR